MSFVYVVIARHPDVVLCEYSDYQGNFMQIAHIILQNSIKPDKKCIINYDKFKIHYINERGLTYLCLSEDMSDDNAFAFLTDIQRKLLENNNPQEMGLMSAYQLDSFTDKLKSIMIYYNSHPTTTKTGSTIKELNLAKSALIENIETLMDRNNKMQIIATKAENLQDFSMNISNVAENLRKSETTRKNKYIIAAVVLVGLLVCLFIFLN